ncbi:MOT12-like protein [Mya arenaria]|uniref:MOT12-like protein n=1 Tax=Mya arenaria TaxID=6604 RepID=A0ABY7G3X3_MYAAR|nr:MOT12-like protein [Mya arenaria]
MTSRTHDIDEGWAWVVLAAVYSGILLVSTVILTAGVLYIELLDYYQDDATKTSIIGSLNSGLLCLLGIGNALSGVPLAVVLVYYFERRRNIVLTLSQAVIGVAIFLASPLALWLLEEYGLKGTFLILAGICAHLCVCAVICKPSVEEEKLKINALKSKDVTMNKPYTYCKCDSLLDLQVLRSLPFVLFLMSTSTWNFMLSVCLMHLPNYVMTKGLNATDITVLMTIFSISNTVGRLSAVFIVDCKHLDNMVVHICCLVIASIFALFFQLYNHLPSAEYVFVAATGILTGLPNSLATPLTLALIGVENISIAHGLVYFFCGIGYVSGPPLAALLLEKTGSYENSFIMSGAVLLFGSVMAVAAKIRQRKAQEERGKRTLNAAAFGMSPKE